MKVDVFRVSCGFVDRYGCLVFVLESARKGATEMTATDQNVKTESQRGGFGKWVLRGLAILILVVALVDLVIMLIPMPSPQRPVSSGGQTVIFHSSETDTSIIRAKNWAESNLNFVGWAARTKGVGPDELYILKRNENWKTSLEVGQIITWFFLLILPFALWVFSARAALRKLVAE
jgi:hypothetical protein